MPSFLTILVSVGNCVDYFCYGQEDSVVIPHFHTLAATAVALAATLPLWGQEQPATESSQQTTELTNQQMAQLIAQNLRESGKLRKFEVDVVFQNGVAELHGTVADEEQRAEAVRIAGGVPGVTFVRDQMASKASRPAMKQVQAVNLPSQEQAPMPAPGAPPATLPPGPLPNGGYPVTQPGVPSTAVPNGGYQMPEPTPIMQGPPPSYYDVNPPKMPPHAWPTYAPYNNYSRVAYPQLYPYNAWPNMGPYYPFPKIPPGWRKVQLEWQDGYWWYSTRGNSHDWWMLRYW
jgi:hypothetical protein